MILVSGIVADEMTELMCARLQDMGLDHLLLDHLLVPGGVDVTWSIDGGDVDGFVMAQQRRVDLAEVSGVYARYAGYRGRDRRGLDGLERDLADAEYQLALMQLFDVIPVLVVNRPMASLSNDSKLWQQQIANRLGFYTPRTLATTVPAEAAAFYAECGERVIYKSLSGVRSIVRRMTRDDLKRLPLLANCPTQFQEHVAGIDVRVHTVDAEVYATEIRSKASDYRYAGDQGEPRTMSAIDLPDDVAERCVDLARFMGLAVAGIDLRRTADGRWACFEVNPSPAFLFYERHTGQPISRAVARLLARGGVTGRLPLLSTH